MTTLDAQSNGRCVVLFGVDIEPTLEGFTLTNGSAVDQGGHSSATAEGDGGAIFVQQTRALIADNVISNSSTPFGEAGSNVTGEGGAGGGVALWQSNATLRGNHIANNEAGSFGQEGGGGVAVRGGSPVIENNIIELNSAGRGGGVYLDAAQATVRGNEIRNNTARDGGGLGAESGDTSLVRRNLIELNDTVIYGGGGGVEVSSAATTFELNEIRANEIVWTSGAGVKLYESQSVFRGNLIHENICSQPGGGSSCGVNISGTTSNTRWYNNAIVNNVSLEGGNGRAIALWISYGTHELYNTTLAGNTGGDGSVVVVDREQANITFVNTLIADQAIGFRSFNSAVIDLDFSLFDNVTTEFDSVAVVNDLHRVTGSAALDIDGFRLTSASDAIDVGTPTAATWRRPARARPVRRGATVRSSASSEASIDSRAAPSPSALRSVRDSRARSITTRC